MQLDRCDFDSVLNLEFLEVANIWGTLGGILVIDLLVY